MTTEVCGCARLTIILFLYGIIYDLLEYVWSINVDADINYSLDVACTSGVSD